MTRVSRWLVLAVLALVAFAVLGVPGWRSSAAPRRVHLVASSGLLSCPAAVRRLGEIAFVARGRLEVVDLAHCRVTVRQASRASAVRFSPNGRWLAYSPLVGGSPSGLDVVSVRGGPVRTPLGAGVLAWTWSRTARRAVLYGIVRDGSLVSAAPNGPRRVVAADVVPISFGYYGEPLLLSPDSRRAAVDRSSCRTPVGELDTVDLRTGARTVAIRRRGEFYTLAGFSPDGRWLLFWAATMCSGSLAADGWPLYAVPAPGGSPVKVVPHMLLYGDFLSWCGSKLIAAAGPDRETETGSTLVEAGPPAWRTHPLRPLTPADRFSWVSPSCAPGGRRMAAAVGPNGAPVSFGLEHRSVWLLRPSGRAIRRLTLPRARDETDEAPRISRDGRWVLFVRSRVGPGDSSHDTIELVRTSGGASVPILDFSSGDFSYYDHFDWPHEVDWHQPR